MAVALSQAKSAKASAAYKLWQNKYHIGERLTEIMKSLAGRWCAISEELIYHEDMAAWRKYRHNIKEENIIWRKWRKRNVNRKYRNESNNEIAGVNKRRR